MSSTLILKHLAEQSEKPALSDTYQCLNGAEVIVSVNAMALKLAGCRVLAVLADNSVDWVLADLATLQLGVVHLPIPTFFNPTQMLNAFEQTCADAILTDQPERITALGLGFETQWTERSLSLMCRQAVAASLPSGTAKISFTSGSTGTPKGVCLSAAGLMATARAIQFTLSDLAISSHLAVLPLTLLLENSAGIYAALLNGAHVHLPSLPSLGWRGMAGFDPAALQQTVQSSAPNSMILVP